MLFFRRYEPKTNKWTFMAPMITKRKHLGCAVYNEFIYAVGGRDDLTELNSVERYNPCTNQWHACQPMKSRRSGVGLAVVNNQLLAVGGFDGSSYLKTVEIYDNERSIWKLCNSMIYRRLGGGVAVCKLQRDLLFSKSNEADNNVNTLNIPLLNSNIFSLFLKIIQNFVQIIIFLKLISNHNHLLIIHRHHQIQTIIN